MRQRDNLKEYIQDMLTMRQITRNQVINTYWTHKEEIEKLGFVPFIIRGALQWKTEARKPIPSYADYVWLQTDYYDPVGKPIWANPVKTYVQQNLNQYDIWGGIQIQIDKQDAQTTKERLDLAVRDISLLCNLASLTTQASLCWFPARYMEINVVEGTPCTNKAAEESNSHLEWVCLPLPRHQEELVSAIVDDDFITRGLLPWFHAVHDIDNSEIGALLRRSIAWHAVGSFSGSGLNRFLNYWEAVELIVHFFYPRLSAEAVKRSTKSERRDQIYKLLTTRAICPSNALGVADECSKILQPSIRTKMESVIPVLTGASNFAGEFFNNNEATNKSLYEIRNDIAHGNYCDHDLEFTETVEARLYDMCTYSRQIILKTIQRLGIIKKLLMNQ